MTLFLSMVLIITLFVSAAPVGAAGELEVDQVFSANADTELPVSQYFDAALGQQYIGVFLKNTGDEVVNNVQVDISVDPGSGITVLEASQDYGNIVADARTVRSFLADFSGVAAGEYAMTINIAGDGDYSKTVDATLMVVASTFLGGNSWQVDTAESSIVFEVDPPACTGDLGTLGLPENVTVTITWNPGYTGQFAPVTYDLAAFVNEAWAAAHAQECCPGGADVVAIRALIQGAVGQALALMDDPFGMGQAATEPGAGETTTEEVVVLNLSYGAGAIVGTSFTADISFAYTRTTDSTSYEASSEESASNGYAVSGRVVTGEVVGTNFVLTASTVPNTTTGYMLALVSPEDNPANIVLLVVLQDDGQGFDLAANDGRYTGGFGDTVLPVGAYVVRVLGYDFEPGSWSNAELVHYPRPTGSDCEVEYPVTIITPSGVGGASTVINN